MTNNWPPPGGTTPPLNTWAPPQSTVPIPAVTPANSWPPPQAAATSPSTWQPPQQGTWPQQPPAAYQPAGWPPPQQGGPPPNYWVPQKTTDDKVLEWVVPINRSGLAIAAGYVSLFSMFLLIGAPVGVLLGVLALRDLRQHPDKGGRGRAWFAIVFGGILTVVLFVVIAWFIAGAMQR